jgi:insertion element IS1 protein InsB
VSRSRDFAAYLPMALRLEEKYRIGILCTDGYDAYGRFIVAKQHVVTKAETALVESKNSLLRLHLARFNRRTRRYSKAFDMIHSAVLLLFNKHLLLSTFS